MPAALEHPPGEAAPHQREERPWCQRLPWRREHLLLWPPLSAFETLRAVAESGQGTAKENASQRSCSTAATFEQHCKLTTPHLASAGCRQLCSREGWGCHLEMQSLESYGYVMLSEEIPMQDRNRLTVCRLDAAILVVRHYRRGCECTCASLCSVPCFVRYAVAKTAPYIVARHACTAAGDAGGKT